MATTWLDEELEKDPSFADAMKCEALVEDTCDGIYAAMDEVNVTAAELSERLGVTRSNVSQLLSGKRNLTLRTLWKIAKALGFEVHPPKLYRSSGSVLVARGAVSSMLLGSQGALRSTTQRITVHPVIDDNSRVRAA